jgi:hypothetical protein
VTTVTAHPPAAEATGQGAAPELSALVVARNEELLLADCLSCLGFADEIVVVLDRCTDNSREIAWQPKSVPWSRARRRTGT